MSFNPIVVADNVIRWDVGITPSLPLGMTPIPFGGALYMLVGSTVLPLSPLRMMQSSDNGATWNELNAAGAPSMPAGAETNAAFLFDPAGKITVAFMDGVGPSPLHFCDFNLNTNLWSAVYALGVAPTLTGYTAQMYKRSNGSLVVMIVGLDVGTGLQGVFCYVWNGASWATTQIYNRLAAPDSLSGVGSCLDASDTLHIFMFRRGAAFPATWTSATIRSRLEGS